LRFGHRFESRRSVDLDLDGVDLADGRRRYGILPDLVGADVGLESAAPVAVSLPAFVEFDAVVDDSDEDDDSEDDQAPDTTDVRRCIDGRCYTPAGPTAARLSGKCGDPGRGVPGRGG
jgi:hypothetical protein